MQSIEWLKGPVWTHPVRLIVPEKIENDHVLVFLKGGDVTSALPALSDELVQGALKTKSIVAEIFALPNQPCILADDLERREDALVAMSWKCLFRLGNKNYPLHKPMAEAVSALLTGLQGYLGERAKNFILTGESKRGWITYLVAAEDKRVKAIIPVVADFLNIKENFTHHFQSLRCWSPAIQDYLDLGLDNRMFA